MRKCYNGKAEKKDNLTDIQGLKKVLIVLIKLDAEKYSNHPLFDQLCIKSVIKCSSYIGERLQYKYKCYYLIILDTITISQLNKKAHPLKTNIIQLDSRSWF